VTRAAVHIDGELYSRVGAGLLVLVGIAVEDTRREADYLAEKLVNLRIFSDADGRMNLSALDVRADLLLVSQFTLYGDCRKGRRPGFDRAAPPGPARELYEYVVERVRASGLTVATGVFQAHMEVELINDGPVTLLLET
jgi:D-tyrosyl-tRNA(Tyr) deacylase